MAITAFTRYPILFEDQDLLIINKPEGILSHPNPGDKNPACSLSSGKQAFEGSYNLSERRFDTAHGPLWLIHRLDQDTSGILLAAKSKQSAEVCRKNFEAQEVEKGYLALVSRKPMPPYGQWKDALTERRTGSGVRAAISPSKKLNAFLNYKTKEFFQKFNLALLEIKLMTGKTHQIRVQSAYHGHPVAGDRVYGIFGLNKELRQTIGLRRMFLHAWRLAIKHPVTQKPLLVESPLPEDLEQCLVRMSFSRKTH